MTVITFGVLGPLAIHLDGQEVELTGLRQRTLLARLLLARGHIVPVDRLIDDLWGDELPEQPSAAIQAFVSRLRRQLEPGRQPRSTASVVVTSHPGYALRPDSDAVDAWRFERLVGAAGATRDQDPGMALEALDESLALWRGPAYAEFADLGWARAEVTRLDELRLQAVEDRADAALRVGRAPEVVSALRPHVLSHPLRERGWALLAAAQYAAGSQGDALATLRQARTALADELGVDPGPALRALEADILAQAEHLPSLPGPPAALPLVERDWFVGRGSEIDRLLAVAERGGIVQLVGDAGVGKSALLDRLAELLTARGWLVGRGRCAETGGVLPGWPWAEAVRALAGSRPPAEPLAGALGWLLHDDSPSDPEPLVGQHRTRLALHRFLQDLSADGRVLLALDDLHRADAETLALLVSVCGALARAPVLIVATRRGSETSNDLNEALAQLAAYEPERLMLGGLGADAVSAILATTLPGPVDPELAEKLTARTGGNPFFVRESARLLAAGGTEAALSAVPEGVQEVLGRRIAQLPAMARNVLASAAVLGRDITLDLLMELSGQNEEVVLEAVEAALVVGLLTEPRPGTLAFPHALVRDAVYETMSQLRRTRLHVRAAAAIEQFRAEDVTAIAHHYETAGDPALASSTQRFARLAAAEAERRYAYREAARWWRVALAAFDQLPDGQPARRLELLVAQVRAVASAGDLVAARDLRDLTLEQADLIDDPVLAAAAIASFDVPTLWTSHPYGSVDVDVVNRTEDVLRRLPPGDSEPRCRMLVNLALELEGEDDERGFAAAREAEAMARRLGDPQLLTMALNAVLLEHYWPGGRDERRRVGAALLELAGDGRRVDAAVLGHMALAQTHVAAGELEAADRHVAAVESLAATYEQPLTSAIVSWYHGLRQVVTGDLEGALAAYAEAERRMARVSMWQDSGDTVTVTTATAWLSVGRMGELAERWGAESLAARLYPELYALALAHAGRIEDARAAAGPLTPIRRDYALDLNYAVRGLLGIAIDDAERVDTAYAALLPFPHLLAAAGSGVLTIAPVAEILGDLAAHRGERGTAVEHYAQAVRVARGAGAAHWADRAGRAADRLG